MIGQTISHYRITETLGAGGMGVVYLADDTALERRVAIKFLPQSVASDAGAIARFKREAKAAAALHHPHIITVYDVGIHDGRPYIVMEHVDGEPLSAVIARKDLSVDRALEIAAQIAEGLAEAHEAGVVHRDIKPDNVLVDRHGRVRILDFGLARLQGATAITDEESTLGTVNYMSPEQTRGEAGDGRSDLFSLGVVLYEMVAGQRPFRGEHRAAVMYAINHQTQQPLRRYNNQASEGLERIVEKMLAKSLDERYPNAAAVLVDLRREGGATGSAVLAGKESRRGLMLGAGALAVALIAAGAWFVGQRKGPDQTETTSARGAATVTETNSLAVLPFVDMSPSKDQEYFSDGLSEELINVLVRIPDLKVSGRTSSFSFKGKNDDLRTIGEMLGVAHILEGSVRKAGKKIRITAQLVKAADGFHLWSETYDRTLDDIFAVQDDIAQSVARELRVTLLSKGGDAPKPNAAAHDLVLQAHFVLTQNLTPASVGRGREIVERALALAPDYAPAWAEMGLVHRREIGFSTTNEERAQALVRTREALAKALELDPGLAVAHSRMAQVQIDAWDFAAAERSMERALAADPRNPDVVSNAATLFVSLGRLDEAIVLLKKAYETDPLSRNSGNNLAGSYIKVGRLDEAEALLRKVLELMPDHASAYANLGDIHLLRGEVKEAREAYARWGELAKTREYCRSKTEALLEHTAGNDAASAATAAEFDKRFGANNSICVVDIRAWRGEADLAFLRLDELLAVRYPFLGGIKADIYLRPLHTDPRWNALLKKIGLPTD